MGAAEDREERLRSVLAEIGEFTEKRMFGGTAFMVNGNMCCGFAGDRLLLRLGSEGATAALNEPHTAKMDFTGRPMKTMVFILPEGYRSEADLRQWVERAVQFARTLPPK